MSHETPALEQAERGSARDTGGRRERTKVANRGAIIEAARAVFSELGYEATTVRDIIRRTDLASGTFYNYFKSKEELYHALHDDGVRRFRPMLRAARDQAGDNFERFLELACSFYFHFLLEVRPIGTALAGVEGVTRVRFDTPESAAMFNELKADIEGYATGGALALVSVDLLTAACIGIAQDVGDLLLEGRAGSAEEAAQFCTRLILGGVRGFETGSTP